MDLREIRDAKGDLEDAHRRLQYWRAGSRSPLRAGRISTKERRELRLLMLEARVNQLRQELKWDGAPEDEDELF